MGAGRWANSSVAIRAGSNTGLAGATLALAVGVLAGLVGVAAGSGLVAFVLDLSSPQALKPKILAISKVSGSDLNFKGTMFIIDPRKV